MVAVYCVCWGTSSSLLDCGVARLYLLCYPPPPPSDLHSITSLLVQALLSQFSEAFVDTGPSPRVKESSSLKEFLTEDYTVLLLLSIQITSHQVRTVLYDSIYCTSSPTPVNPYHHDTCTRVEDSRRL